MKMNIKSKKMTLPCKLLIILDQKGVCILNDCLQNPSQHDFKFKNTWRIGKSFCKNVVSHGVTATHGTVNEESNILGVIDIFQVLDFKGSFQDFIVKYSEPFELWSYSLKKLIQLFLLLFIINAKRKKTSSDSCVLIYVPNHIKLIVNFKAKILIWKYSNVL